MNAKICPVAAFLAAARGNWRNALFIECTSCVYGRRELCRGFLVAFDADAAPVVIRAEQLAKASGELPDKEECAAILGRHGFEQLFASWILWKLESPRECALFKLAYPLRKT